MNKKTQRLITIISSLSISSCSSFNSTSYSSAVYGGLAGGAVGAISGHTFSPNKESDVFNTVVWGAVGTFIGSGIGYLLRADDPDNQEMKQMIKKDKSTKDNEIQSYNGEELGFKLVIPSESKSYVVPPQNLPENLKDKIKKQIITEHLLKERIEKKENGKTLVYPETKVYEYDYQ